MAISDTEKLDYLWKKIGYGVAKTDLAANKLAYNEAIPSPLLIRGDKLWAESGSIPASKPSSSSSIVTVYKDGGGAGYSPTVQTTEDLGASDNRTWKTNLTDWIPPELGATYLVSVYIDTTGSTTPQTTGTQIYGAGASSSSNDEWFFDYQAGVLHFIGVNLPTDIATGVTGKSIFVSGARYVGVFGVTGTVSANSANLGNFNISNNSITATNTNGGVTIAANGTGNITFQTENANATGNLNVTGNLTVSTLSVTGTVSIPATTASSITTSTIISSNSNIAVTTNTVIDQFGTGAYRTAKYVIKASSDAGYESTEVLLVHDGLESYITVYGAITTNTDVINLSSNIVGPNVKLYATGTTANTVVNYIGTYVRN
jgi:hypothetical protein